MFQSPGPLAFQIGPLSIHWYGIIIATGILLCYWYAVSQAKRRKIDFRHIENMALWVIFSGVLGARIYYILFFNPSYFLSNPLEILKIWQGGLAIHGALIGGALAYTIYTRSHRLSFFTYLDLIAPGVLLAQGLGRWGNFFNNEAFGRPTDLPWKLFIPVEFRPEEYKSFNYFHPTFLYESVWNLIGFLILVILGRRFPKGDSESPHTAGGRAAGKTSGIIFFSYLIWYSFGRFFIEGLRTDSLYLGPFRIAQIISLLLFILGMCGLLFLFRRHKIKSL